MKVSRTKAVPLTVTSSTLDDLRHRARMDSGEGTSYSGGAAGVAPADNNLIGAFSGGTPSAPNPLTNSGEGKRVRRLRSNFTRSASTTQRPEVAVATAADLGSLIKAARMSMHLNQQSFADLAGVGRRFVSELENGKATLEVGLVLRVCTAAGINVVAGKRR